MRLFCSKRHQRLLLDFTFSCLRINLGRKHQLPNVLVFKSLSLLLWLGIAINCNPSEAVSPALIAGSHVGADRHGPENFLHSGST